MRPRGLGVAGDRGGQFGGLCLADFEVGDLFDALVELFDFELERLNVGELDVGDVAVLVGGAGEGRVNDAGLGGAGFVEVLEEGVHVGFLP